MNMLRRAKLRYAPLYIVSVVLLGATWLTPSVSASWLREALLLLPLAGFGLLTVTLFLMFKHTQDEMNKIIWLKALAFSGAETMLLLVTTDYLKVFNFSALGSSQIFCFWLGGVLGARLIFTAQTIDASGSISPAFVTIGKPLMMAAGALLPFRYLYQPDFIVYAVRKSPTKAILLAVLAIALVSAVVGGIAGYSAVRKIQSR